MSPILNADSYKASHFLQYPHGTEHVFSYVESRGGAWNKTLFFGLQPILRKLLASNIDQHDVSRAEAFLKPHGLPFNEIGWSRIVHKHGGRLPLLIRALPEGSIVPTGTPLMTIVNTDPELPWLTSYVETALLRVWYPITVATLSWHIRQTIKRYLEETADNPAEELPFKLHDFGARGASSQESAELGGMAHLVSFEGTDNLPALVAAFDYYEAENAGFSIPAAEHSTITAWGRDGEADAYENMLDRFPGPVAIVSDSYDLYGAIARLWGGTLKQKVLDHEGTVIIRPDSGDPVQTVIVTLALLRALFGYTVNSKGYTVLNKVRVLQGDGVNQDSIDKILQKMKDNGFSASNISFGMGGALLQGVNRDTLRFAYKASAARIKGEWRDVYKDPVTDPGKRSKRGLLSCSLDGSVYHPDAENVLEPMNLGSMEVVYHNGEFYAETTLDEVRERMRRQEEALQMEPAE